jgi:hypothetical protein
MRACMCVYACVYVRVCACKLAWLRSFQFLDSTCALKFIDIDAYIHTYIHTYIPAHTVYKHTHIETLKSHTTISLTYIVCIHALYTRIHLLTYQYCTCVATCTCLPTYVHSCIHAADIADLFAAFLSKSVATGECTCMYACKYASMYFEHLLVKH